MEIPSWRDASYIWNIVFTGALYSINSRTLSGRNKKRMWQSLCYTGDASTIRRQLPVTGAVCPGSFVQGVVQRLDCLDDISDSKALKMRAILSHHPIQSTASAPGMSLPLRLSSSGPGFALLTF
jgi:hypothetical protein